MQVAGAGGGYDGTDWATRDVRQIWQAIENQDTTAHYELLKGWQRSYELILQHLTEVENYRQNLASAWPPHKSVAAAAYIARLDNLITNLQYTYSAAAASYGALAGATLAITQARRALQEIYSEYASNQVELETYRNRPILAGKSAVLPSNPPVTEGRQEALTNQARAIMFDLSKEIVQARDQISIPFAYDPAVNISDNKSDVATQHYAAPPVHPVVPYDPGLAGSRSDHLAGHGAPTDSTARDGSALFAGSPNSSRPSLVLGGVTPSTVSLPTTTNVPAPTPIDGSPPPAIIGSVPPIPPSNSRRLPAAPPAFMDERPVGRNGDMRRIGGTRVMPSGGVVGGAPGIGVRRTITGPSPQRVNPVGGVIDAEVAGDGTSATGRGAGVPVQTVAGVTGRNTGRHDNAFGEARWDPNDHWVTAEGVAPVVLPPREQGVDPGPAIGLG